jgi:hypothetical protein
LFTNTLLFLIYQCWSLAQSKFYTKEVLHTVIAQIKRKNLRIKIFAINIFAVWRWLPAHGTDVFFTANVIFIRKNFSFTVKEVLHGRSFCIKVVLRKWSFYTNEVLRKWTFTQIKFLHKWSFAQMNFCMKEILHKWTFEQIIVYGIDLLKKIQFKTNELWLTKRDLNKWTFCTNYFFLIQIFFFTNEFVKKCDFIQKKIKKQYLSDFSLK